MRRGNYKRALKSGHCLLLAAAVFARLTASGQTYEAISRETSLFNFGQSSANAEAISREVSLFNLGQPSTSLEAISRELSVFNLGAPSANVEAISREVSLFNLGVPSTGLEAVSHELSIFNLGVSSANVEAFSREVSLFNFGQSSIRTEAISREVSLFNFGVPQVFFSIGSTNALGNETNKVPLVLQTILDLTNLNLTVKTDDSHLRILGVTPASTEVVAAGVGPLSSNGYPVAFTLNPATLPPTNRVLAYLNFQGITNLDSAIVPLIATNLTSSRVNGQAVPSVASNGQVILIVSRPILFTTNKTHFGVTMYGVPGTTDSIQATTNLAPAEWYELERLFVSGRMMNIPGLATNAPRQFFRTEQVGP